MGEWQELQFLREVRRPAAASPTTILSATSAPGGGEPCRCIVAATEWMYSATALTSSSGSGSGGITGMPGFIRPFLTTGRINSPC